MNILEIRPEFKILFFSSHEEKRLSLQSRLETSGYQGLIVREWDHLNSSLKEELPHVFVFDISQLAPSDVHNTLQWLRSFSEEMSILLLGTWESCHLYQSYLITDIVSEILNWQEILFLRIDKTIEILYYKYQNEELISSYQKFKFQADSTQNNKEWENLFLLLEKSRTVEEVFAQFFSFFQNDRLEFIHFKYFPMTSALILQQSNIENKTGLGIKLEQEEIGKGIPYFEQISKNPRFIKFLEQIFKTSLSVTIPFVRENEVISLLCILDLAEGSRLDQNIKTYLPFLNEIYLRLYYQERLRELEVIDEVTQFHNEKSFQIKLNEEISRARRLELPLSLLTFSLDTLSDFKRQFGPEKTNHLLKAITHIVRKTGRTNDFNARIKENEFVILAPHTDFKGALIRADRLRHTVSTAQFKFLPESVKIQITLSFGVCEYPRLSKDAEDMVVKSNQSLYLALHAGGNRTFLTQVSSGFRPDYLVKEM